MAVAVKKRGRSKAAKAEVKHEKVKKVAVVKEPVDLKAAEAALVKRYKPSAGKEYFIVPDSLWESDDPRNEEYGYHNKRTVEILCQYDGCDATRRIATSDLHQVRYCQEHSLQIRRERRQRQRAKAKKAKG